MASDSSKPIDTLVVDTGPLIKNDPPVSTLLSRATTLYTIPSVLAEIRDADTRQRVDTTLVPFLKLRNPRPESIKHITDFARKTGDLSVLSRTDIHLVALTYELEEERKKAAGIVEGLKDATLEETKGSANDIAEEQDSSSPVEPASETSQSQPKEATEASTSHITTETNLKDSTSTPDTVEPEQPEQPQQEQEPEQNAEQVESNEAGEPQPIHDQDDDNITQPPPEDTDTSEWTTATSKKQRKKHHPPPAHHFDDDDPEWITPTNLDQHKTQDSGIQEATSPIQQHHMHTAILTSDFAMQNVSLRVGLSVVSPSLARITQLKTWVKRCHGCFAICREMERKFCPRCGQPNLIRASCSTDEHGNFQVHLKKNFQWNNRGNVYSVPKPVAGTSSGKVSKQLGGGKNGWGINLMLSEDQKELQREEEVQKRTRQRDLMDEDYLPNVLTGERTHGSRIRIGAGRGINSKSGR